MYIYDESELMLSPPEEIENIECEDVVLEEFEEIKKLGEAMINFCVENGGLGLAAPQVGVKKNMFVWRNGENSFQIILNPKIFPEKKTTNVAEGCLSYPGDTYLVKRFKKIRIKFFYVKDGEMKTHSQNIYNEKAFIFQHELDHLSGKTIATKGYLLSKADDGKKEN